MSQNAIRKNMSVFYIISPGMKSSEHLLLIPSISDRMSIEQCTVWCEEASARLPKLLIETVTSKFFKLNTL